MQTLWCANRTQGLCKSTDNYCCAVLPYLQTIYVQNFVFGLKVIDIKNISKPLKSTRYLKNSSKPWLKACASLIVIIPLWHSNHPVPEFDFHMTRCLGHRWPTRADKLIYQWSPLLLSTPIWKCCHCSCCYRCYCCCHYGCWCCNCCCCRHCFHCCWFCYQWDLSCHCYCSHFWSLVLPVILPLVWFMIMIP